MFDGRTKMRILILAAAASLAAGPAFAQNQTSPVEIDPPPPPEAREPASPEMPEPAEETAPVAAPAPPPPAPERGPSAPPIQQQVDPNLADPRAPEPGFSPDEPYPNGFADPIDAEADELYAAREDDGFPWGLLGLLGLLGLFGLAGRRGERPHSVYRERREEEPPLRR